MRIEILVSFSHHQQAGLITISGLECKTPSTRQHLFIIIRLTYPSLFLCLDWENVLHSLIPECCTSRLIWDPCTESQLVKEGVARHDIILDLVGPE